MKMVKKILLGMVATAAVLTFASCGQREEAGNSEMIDVNAGSSKASIDYTNDGDSVTRGFKTLQTKHLDALCTIETTVTDLVAGKNAKANGTMGYIFNIVKDANDKYSFTIAGVRYNQVSGAVEAYVETFKNVAKDNLEKELTDGVHASGSKAWGTSDFGFTLLTKAEVDVALAAQTTTPKKLTLYIDVIANDGATTGRTGTAGTYTVNFYTQDPKRKSSSKSYNLEWENNTGTNGPEASFTIQPTEVNTTYDATKGLTSMQADVGFYANVYAGQTLKGTWQFSQIKKEAEEIEE